MALWICDSIFLTWDAWKDALCLLLLDTPLHGWKDAILRLHEWKDVWKRNLYLRRQKNIELWDSASFVKKNMNACNFSHSFKIYCSIKISYKKWDHCIVLCLYYCKLMCLIRYLCHCPQIIAFSWLSKAWKYYPPVLWLHYGLCVVINVSCVYDAEGSCYSRVVVKDIGFCLLDSMEDRIIWQCAWVY